MWEARDAEVTSTSWDVKGPALDFGAGAPVWLQRTIPTFIQNHLIVVRFLVGWLVKWLFGSW